MEMMAFETPILDYKADYKGALVFEKDGIRWGFFTAESEHDSLTDPYEQARSVFDRLHLKFSRYHFNYSDKFTFR